MALGEGRQRNMREEGFELLMKQRQWNYTREDKLFKYKHLPEEKPAQGSGRLGGHR